MRNSLSVKQLNNYIRNVFEDELVLQNITVTGEVYEVSYSKYTFITLKEDDCILQCVCFNRIVAPKQGQRTALSGSVNFSERLGKVSFVVKSIEVLGNGLYQAEYLKAKENLKNMGFFDKKLPLPVFIKNVCIITSGYGSVIHDFLAGIADGHSYIDVTVLCSSVQGDEAINDIISNLKKADNNFDVVVIARGGGSATDLECFNSQRLAEAVGRMHVPVISAVGHETDYSLCDLCASYRAGTPSFAAKRITENNGVIIDRFYALTRRAGETLARKLSDKASALAVITSRTVFAASAEINRRRERVVKLASRALMRAESNADAGCARIKTLSDNVVAAAEKLSESKSTAIKNCAVKLEYLSPLKVLTRGYCAAEKDGGAVTSVRQIDRGDAVSMIFADGKARATIDETEEKRNDF